MGMPQKYDPPEAVVGPAFTELLNRLAKARVQTTSGLEMSEEERKIWDYGVSERKRVLEHTLFLVFGQWAVYRQVVSRLQSRGMRVAYGIGSFVSSCYFLSARAKRVSHEMFATIATMATSAPLGNEARVVLAELEGPEGPYFRRICREKGFKEDMASVIASLDAKDGVDPTSDHVHPQLRLRPRLPVPGGGRDGNGDKLGQRVDFKPVRVQRGRVVVGKESGEVEMDEDLMQIRQELRGMRSRERKREDAEGGEEGWGKPFDFRKAAVDAGGGEGGSFEVEEEIEMELTPSQRRAKERKERRMRMRGHAEGTDA